MDRMGGAGRLGCFFHFWGLDCSTPGPLLPHLLWDHHRFFHHIHEEDWIESERMVFKKIGWGDRARIDLRGLDGPECPIEA